MPISPQGKETGWISKWAFQIGALAADIVGRQAIADAYFAATATMRAKFADGFINAAKLASNAVTTIKIAAGAVTAAKLNVTLSPGSGQLAYVGRTPRSGWDKFLWTHMANYADWGVASITGGNAVKVKLWVLVNDVLLDSVISFRKNGETNWNYGQTHMAYNRDLLGQSWYYEIECDLDSAKKLEYKIYAANGVRIQSGAWLIIGWWEPITTSIS